MIFVFSTRLPLSHAVTMMMTAIAEQEDRRLSYTQRVWHASAHARFPRNLLQNHSIEFHDVP